MAGCGRKNADDLLAAALAAGKTIKDAAAEAGIGERTARRRMESPEFQARIAELRNEMVQAAARTLAAKMGRAAEVLGNLLDDPDPARRMKAAVHLLRLGIQCTEVADLAQRLVDLETELARPGERGSV